MSAFKPSFEVGYLPTSNLNWSNACPKSSICLFATSDLAGEELAVTFLVDFQMNCPVLSI
jgi:hypothetical protein